MIGLKLSHLSRSPPATFAERPCCRRPQEQTTAGLHVILRVSHLHAAHNASLQASLPSRTTGNAGLTRVFDAAKSRPVANVPKNATSCDLTTGDAASVRGVPFFSAKQRKGSCRIYATALFEPHQVRRSYAASLGISAAPSLAAASS
jgi:hypothetical protein